MSFPYSALCAQLFDALSAEILPEQLGACYVLGDRGTTTTTFEGIPEGTANGVAAVRVLGCKGKEGIG